MTQCVAVLELCLILLGEHKWNQFWYFPQFSSCLVIYFIEIVSLYSAIGLSLWVQINGLEKHQTLAYWSQVIDNQVLSDYVKLMRREGNFPGIFVVLF